MEHARIPGLDGEVSRIGLGTWAIGGWMWGGTEKKAALRTIQAALDLGITLVDTAPVYGFGRSEEIVGEAIAEHGSRDRVVIATKVGIEWDETHERLRRNSSPERIQKELEDSLRRLRTDHIDLYQVHWPDPKVPFEETARALEALREAGKIRAIGVSNYSPEQMKGFGAGAELASAQPPYNLFERGVEQDVLPWCASHDVAVLAYGPLCRGLLSGHMSRGREFPGDDLRNDDPKFRGERFDRYLAAVARLDELARRRFGKRVLHLALRWVLDQPAVTVALWGARHPDQLEAIGEVDGWSVDADAKAEIDALLADAIPDPVGPEFMAPPLD